MSVQPGSTSKLAATRRLSASTRRAVLTVHIVASVGLLGDVAAVLAINVKAATTGDPGLAAASYELLALLTVLFGIPLSLLSLASGVVLVLGSKWGVLRYAWATTKLSIWPSTTLPPGAASASMSSTDADLRRSSRSGAQPPAGQHP